MSSYPGRSGVTAVLTVVLATVVLVFTSCSSSDPQITIDAADRVTTVSVAANEGEFCDAYIAYFFSGQESAGAIGPGDEDDPAYLEDSRAFFASASEHLAEAARVAPPEIEADIVVMADAWGDANDKISNATSTDDIPEDFLETSEFQEAASNVGNYAGERCDMAAGDPGLDG